LLDGNPVAVDVGAESAAHGVVLRRLRRLFPGGGAGRRAAGEPFFPFLGLVAVDIGVEHDAPAGGGLALHPERGQAVDRLPLRGGDAARLEARIHDQVGALFPVGVGEEVRPLGLFEAAEGQEGQVHLHGDVVDAPARVGLLDEELRLAIGQSRDAHRQQIGVPAPAFDLSPDRELRLVETVRQGYHLRRRGRVADLRLVRVDDLAKRHRVDGSEHVCAHGAATEHLADSPAEDAAVEGRLEIEGDQHRPLLGCDEGINPRCGRRPEKQQRGRQGRRYADAVCRHFPSASREMDTPSAYQKGPAAAARFPPGAIITRGGIAAIADCWLPTADG